jgi:spermidine synthase
LVGGLGLGFTLAAVLADSRVEQCCVAELEPDLVGWLRADLVPGTAVLLSDPRVEVVVGDVADTIAAAPAAAYDLVLLDVDNGPGHLVHQANAGLYSSAALTKLRTRVAPGGAVVVWSADAAPALAQALGQAFQSASAFPWEVNLQGRLERYWLYVGAVPV